MRGILFCACLAGMLLAGCGSKKRASRPDPVPTGVKTASTATGDLPEDTGEFIFFAISSPEEYIRTFAPIAQREMQAYRIPASITLAQGLLESGFGMGELTRKTNNHFGIKCHTGWEGDYAHHDDDARGECFRKYNHPMHSFRDHSIFLSSRSRYGSLFSLEPDDYRGWARGLKAAGYATDRRYPHKLIELIERYGLQKYDSEVLGTPIRREAPVTLSEGIYNTHRVQAGDTLYALSRRYGMSVDELMKINRLSSSALAIGQLLKVRIDSNNK
ncbi:glucosaminidase domain-containing protein [Robiginitalea sp. SC105]|uniref:glucosaminidase domain-containing protein n=1 Tax=Robiginitalea sp. SC105 TaxID=2762332 RepID=UPI00163B39C3|nr:glucosaminidase domain-containing protein [Robiginitalea sp. SC105]MBC2837717.1 glucosaminidase domain-containing protein [Robiginitalea sp. SC105]